MFKIFQGRSIKKLEKKYAAKLEEARDAQRSGKIPLYATLTAEAEAIADEIDEMRRRD